MTCKGCTSHYTFISLILYRYDMICKSHKKIGKKKKKWRNNGGNDIKRCEIIINYLYKLNYFSAEINFHLQLIPCWYQFSADIVIFFTPNPCSTTAALRSFTKDCFCTGPSPLLCKVLTISLVFMTYNSFRFDRISNSISSIRRPMFAKCVLFSFTAQVNSV